MNKVYAGFSRANMGVIITLTLGVTLSQGALADTVVNSPAAKNLLLGKHYLTHQFISWRHPRTVTITERNGTLFINGMQKGRRLESINNYVKIDGKIILVEKKLFKFQGTISVKKTDEAGPEPCIRKGIMTFRISGKRRYWRMKENREACNIGYEYVDIHFRGPK